MEGGGEGHERGTVCVAACVRVWLCLFGCCCFRGSAGREGRVEGGPCSKRGAPSGRARQKVQRQGEVAVSGLVESREKEVRR